MLEFTKTKEQFIEWLKDGRLTRTFDQIHVFHCAIAQFIGPGYIVGERTFYNEATKEDGKLPDWAISVSCMHRRDASGNAWFDYTGQQILDHLENVT